MKIAVALSGGVDSTTVAQRLQKEGHEIIGLTMRLCPDLSGLPLTSKAKKLAQPGHAEHGCAACIAPCACVDGVEVAKRLGIAHEILDLRTDFENLVIAPFVREYSEGLTPNPCSICNRLIKFGLLLEKAKALGADLLATGHYACVQQVAGQVHIRRAKDLAKDQTYFLALVPQARFERVLFPLCDAQKADVEREAQQAGLALEQSETSTEICFLRELSYVDFLKSRVPAVFSAGDIVDTAGKKVGEHAGVAHFTIGQRRGIGVAAAHPLFVIRLDPDKNQVVVGKDEDLWSTRVWIKALNWPEQLPKTDQRVKAMIRYRQVPMDADIQFTGEYEALLTFAEPVRAVTPGQIAAIYAQDRLLGGGCITFPGDTA